MTLLTDEQIIVRQWNSQLSVILRNGAEILHMHAHQLHNHVIKIKINNKIGIYLIFFKLVNIIK